MPPITRGTEAKLTNQAFFKFISGPPVLFLEAYSGCSLQCRDHFPAKRALKVIKMTRIGILLLYTVCSIDISTSCCACSTCNYELKEALTEPNVHVDVLCERFFAPRHPLVSYVQDVFNVRTWCGYWKKYFALVKDNVMLNINTLVILPQSVLNGSFHDEFSRNLEDYQLTKWVVIADKECSGAGFENLSILNSTNVIVWPGDIDFSQDVFWPEKRSLRRSPSKTPVRLTRLANTRLRLGCLYGIQLNGDCSLIKSDALQEALRSLKVSITKVPTHPNGSVKNLNRNSIDIVYADIAVSHKGFKSVFYPGMRHHHHVVYYVGQRAVRQGNILSLWSFLEFFSVLIASLVACLLTFSMINYCAGRNTRSDIADTCMALTAAVLMLSSAVPRRFKRSSSGRTVFISWFVAGFSLSVFCHSLLISSVTSGTRWEADDTPAKLWPKLTEGRVSVCTEEATYFNVLLKSSVNDTDILGTMSRATIRHPKLFYSGTGLECFERVARRTHVYLSEKWNPCDVDVAKHGHSITVGKEPIQTLFTGHPVKKGFRYRREIAFVVGRIFETGWDKRVDDLDSRNCSLTAVKGVPPMVPVDVSRCLSLYFILCGFAAVVLVFEVVANRFWG